MAISTRTALRSYAEARATAAAWIYVAIGKEYAVYAMALWNAGAGDLRGGASG